MHVIVAVEGEIVVGTVSASYTYGEGHLRGMAVLPQSKGTGIASKLLREVEHWLQAEGCSRITLDTTEPLLVAMRFYEKHGYRRSGRTTDFYGMPLIEYEKELATNA